MKVFLASGTDQHVFSSTLMLAECFRRVCGLRIQVCDFGMTADQVALLSQCANVVPRPAALEGDLHPWKLKAALGRYADETGEAYDAFVWIDCDILVLPGFLQEFERLLLEQRKAGAVVAAAPDANGQSLDGFCQRLKAAGQDLQYFETQIADRGLDRTNPYLNSGFFICLDRGVMEDWQQITWQSTDSALFEQNAFNVAVRATGNVMTLRRAEWNVHGPELAEVRPVPDRPGSFVVDGAPVRAVHATSESLQHHELRVVNWSIEDRQYEANLKLFRNPPLRQIQIDSFLGLIERSDTRLLKPFLKG